MSQGLAFEFISRIAHTGIDRIAALRILKTKIAESSNLWDYFIRLQMLEGAAGKSYGTWFNAGKRGFDLARSYFEDEGVELHPDWYSTNNEKLYVVALSGAKKVLKGNPRIGQDADGLVTDAIMGVSSLSGDRIEPMFYSLGEGNRKEILSGKSPHKFKGNIAAFTKRKAIDEWRKYKQKLDKVIRPNMDDHSYGPGDVKPDQVYIEPDKYITPQDFLLSVLTGKGLPGDLGKYARAIRLWMDDQVEKTPGLSSKGQEIVRLYLEKVRKGKEKGSLSEVAREFDTSPSSVSHMRKKYLRHVSEAAKKDRRIQKMIQDINLRHHTEYEQTRRLAAEKRRIAAIRLARLHREASRESYIPKDSRKKAKPIKFPEDLPLEGWTWESTGKNRRGEKVKRWYVLIFRGRQSRPVEHGYTTSKRSRQQIIDNEISFIKEREEAKRKRREEKKNFEHGLKVGDILSASWGYNQTNVDFYEVTKVIGKSIEIREISGKTVSDDGHSMKVSPDPGHYVGPKMKKIPQTRGKDSVYVKINSHTNARPWDGKLMYQTSPYAGH